MMDAAMVTLDWPGDKPSLTEAARALNVAPSDLDSSFGVVLIDPKTNTYTVQCRSQACTSLPNKSQFGGPYANPGIGTFGPLTNAKR